MSVTDVVQVIFKEKNPSGVSVTYGDILANSIFKNTTLAQIFQVATGINRD